MSVGIRRKTVQKNTRQFDANARRYIFYPLSNLDLIASQSTSPVWNPKIKKGRITLLESFQYLTQVSDDDPEQSAGRGGGVKLGERTMGTDAQVAFLMGNAAGTGYLEKGMKHLESMVDLDYDSAEEIEALLIGDSVPDTLVAFQAKLKGVDIPANSPVAEIASETLREMKSSVDMAIAYCRTYTASLEKELREGQAGKMGIKSLSPIHEYYFEQIEKPLPEDRAGVNTGNQIATALRQVLGHIPATEGGSSMENEVEMAELKRQLQESQETIKEQAEALEALTAEETTIEA